MLPVESLNPDAVFVYPVNIDFLGDDRGSWGFPSPDFEQWDFRQCDDYLKTFGHSLRLTMLSRMSSNDLKKLALVHGADKSLVELLTREGLLGYTAGVVTDDEVRRVETWREEALSLLKNTRQALSPEDELAYRLPGISEKDEGILALRLLISNHLPVGVVELMDGNFYLVLCREMPDRNRAVAEAYIALSYLPPICCCDLRLDVADIDSRTIAACYRTCQMVREHSNKLLHRLENYRSSR